MSDDGSPPPRHTLRVATAQMDVEPAPLASRLQRAKVLVDKAVAAGCDLLVLPELWNIGYRFSDDAFGRAEPSDGPTTAWLRETAAEAGLYLAGSHTVVDKGEVYNRLFLCAPDGQRWTYDKMYPFAWERIYFRESDRVPVRPVVATTPIGRIGLIVCWDCAHLDIWRQYAGKVDFVLGSSCPWDVSGAEYSLGGEGVRLKDLGSFFKGMEREADMVFTDIVTAQAAWMGVPFVNSSGCGVVRTPIPHAPVFSGLLVRGLALLAPRLRGTDTTELSVTSPATSACKIVNADGQILASRSNDDGEGIAVAGIEIAKMRPARPTAAQPPSPLDWFSYLFSDHLATFTSRGNYVAGYRRAFGDHMCRRDIAWNRKAKMVAVAVVVILVALILRWAGVW